MMDDELISTSPRCQEIQELLPWYTEGTLEPEERTRVEGHLEACPACASEARFSRALGTAVAADGPAAPKPHPRELARLLAKIDLDEERWPRRLLAWRGPALWQGTPRAVRWVVAAQGLLAIVLGGMLLESTAPRQPPQEAGVGAPYRTLSELPMASDAPRRLRVMFTEEVSEKSLRQLLLPLEAQIVSGPSPLGVYTLTVPGGQSAASEPMVLAHLRSRPEVRFVEPLEPESRP